jgi:hypothetical protein
VRAQRDTKHDKFYRRNVLRKRDDFFHGALRARHENASHAVNEIDSLYLRHHLRGNASAREMGQRASASKLGF